MASLPTTRQAFTSALECCVDGDELGRFCAMLLFASGHSSAREMEDTFIETFIAEVDRCLDPCNLHITWSRLLKEETSVLAVKYSNHILTGHRILANFLEMRTKPRFSAVDWNRTMSRVLIDSIECSDVNANEILMHLPRESHKVFLMVLCELKGLNPQLTSLIRDSLQASWALESISMLVEILKSDGSVMESSVWTALIANALREIKTTVIAKAIFLNSRLPPECSDFCTSLFSSKLCAAAVLDVVICTYGDTFFVNKGDLKKHSFLTSTILSILKQFNEADLRTISNEDDSSQLLGLLTKAISVNLDGSNRIKRLNSMRVACEFARIVGQKLEFDELKESSSTFSKEEDTTAAPVSPTYDGEHDSDSSSEDDFADYEEFDLSKCNGDSANEFKLYYLSSCIELMRLSDGAQLYDKHRAALKYIPIIISHGPADGLELSATLAREIILMPNSMGIEDFTELQGRALHAVLTAYPTGTIPALSETLISDSRGIGDKVIVLAVLARGALTLAGIEQDNFDLKRIGNDAPIVESGGTSVAVGKTVIKRPIKLRVMKERTRYFNNPLANLIPSFIFPVEQLLVRVLEPKEHRILDTDSQFLRDNFVTPSDMKDGPDTMLPSSALGTLAVLVRCAVNTHAQQGVYREVLRLALCFKKSISLSLRTAAFTAVHASVESWHHLRLRSRVSQESSSRVSGGAVGVLMNVLGRDLVSGGELDSIAAQDDAVMSSLADWVVESLQTEPDKDCQSLLKGVLHLVVKAFESIEAAADSRMF